jgi:secondary thiamine-phosphate synthase enzyme
MVEFTIRTRSRTDFVDATGGVQEAVDELAVGDGAVLVYVPHTTAAVTINEGADPAVVRDIDMELSKIVPYQDGYHHAEGNSDAHIKSSLFGCSELVAVRENRLVLGTWQRIWFCDFDGPRSRRVQVSKL